MTQFTQLSAVRKSRISTPITMGTRLNAYLKTRIPNHSAFGIKKGTQQPRKAGVITDADQDRGNCDPANDVSAKQAGERTAAAEKRARRLQALAVEL